MFDESRAQVKNYLKGQAIVRPTEMFEMSYRVISKSSSTCSMLKALKTGPESKIKIFYVQCF